MEIKTFVIPLSLITEEMRRDNKRYYFEMCGLGSVYAYALTKQAEVILERLELRGRNLK
jgi:hypothetical protein